MKNAKAISMSRWISKGKLTKVRSARSIPVTPIGWTRLALVSDELSNQSPCTYIYNDIPCCSESKATLFFVSRRIASRIHETSDIEKSFCAQS